MDNDPIKTRFFEAIEALKQTKRIGGIHDFANIYHLNSSNLFQVRSQSKRCVKAEWIMYLARDYGISVEWVILGIGSMYKKYKTT